MDDKIRMVARMNVEFLAECNELDAFDLEVELWYTELGGEA